MACNALNRRQALLLVAGAGLTGIFHAESQAQSKLSPEHPAVTARSAGSAHRTRLKQTSGVLRGANPISQEGLLTLINSLEKQGVISKQQAEQLNDLVKLIFTSETLSIMLERVNELLSKLKGGANDLAIAITDIARDSIQFIRDTFERLSKDATTRIVASDVLGALEGAGHGARILGAHGAIAGAIIGASATSILAAYAMEP